MQDIKNENENKDQIKKINATLSTKVALREILEPYQKMMTLTQNALPPQWVVINPIPPSLEPPIQTLASLQKIINPLGVELQQYWLVKATEHFREISEKLDKIRISTNEADELLKKYKWLISPYLPLSFLSQVMKVNKNKKLNSRMKRNKINKIYLEFFTDDHYKNLSLMVESWKENPLFKRRMKILRDCIWALKDTSGNFNASNLVLPPLISQIDGIISDYLIKNGWTFEFVHIKKGKAIGKWVDKSGNDNTNFTSNVKCFAHIARKQIEFPESPTYVIMEIFFQTAYNNKKLKNPFTFCRHKIIHGEYISYGRIDNTIRAFLILDFLSDLE